MKYCVVDAFTQYPFGGNPAAVVILDRLLADDQLQSVAAEFNLSETAFLHKKDDGRWHLRWFTPKVEIELCGHATLASAHALWHEFGQAGDELIFSTLSGDLIVRRNTSEGDSGNLEMAFPPKLSTPINLPADLLDQLRLQPLAVVQAANKCLIEVPTSDLVLNYKADSAVILQLPAQGMILTAENNSAEFLVGGVPADFVSRFFAPAVGIAEDPVTGSAHCVLGPYWSEKLGKNELLAKQISERGGELNLRVTDEYVFIGGQAVTVMKGELSNV